MGNKLLCLRCYKADPYMRSSNAVRSDPWHKWDHITTLTPFFESIDLNPGSMLHVSNCQLVHVWQLLSLSQLRKYMHQVCEVQLMRKPHVSPSQQIVQFQFVRSFVKVGNCHCMCCQQACSPGVTVTVTVCDRQWSNIYYHSVNHSMSRGTWDQYMPHRVGGEGGGPAEAYQTFWRWKLIN